jgi:proline dehydrogenase
MAWRAAARYVAGGSVDDAMRVVAELDAQGVTASIDQIGESVEDIRVARQVADDYVGLAGRLADTPASAGLCPSPVVSWKTPDKAYVT